MEKEIILALIAGLSGAVFTYFFGIRTLVKQKNIDIKTEFLIDAWLKLEDASNRDDSSKNNLVEEAIAKIQLFDNSKQIELSREFVEGIRDKTGASLLPLLMELRQDLRLELKLSKVTNEHLSCRLKK